MTQQLDKTSTKPQLRERAPMSGKLSDILANRKATIGRCLLLDVSGSMKHPCGGERRIDRLRTLAEEFPNERRLVFSVFTEELAPGQSVPGPQSSTNLAGAFLHCKGLGIQHVVLISDGEPDYAIGALEAAKGLRVDVLYAGDGKAPEFMWELANACNGKYGKVELSQDILELADSVRGLLSGGTE